MTEASPGSGPASPPVKPPLAALPFLEHLRELRKRLIIAIAALFVGVLAGFPLAQRAIDGLKVMCATCNPESFKVLNLLDGFATYFRVSLVLGLVVAMPVILYQVVAFVVPALYPRERRILYVMLPGAAVLFALGMLFGYVIVMPRTMAFLDLIARQLADPGYDIVLFIRFAMYLLLILGVAFQTPLVIYAFAKVGLLKPELMKRYRRHALMAFAVLAAILTPTPDPVTMLLVMGPMYLLYEAGLLLARVF
jgi:sec-independent protein translocase protein TatC